VRARYVHTNVVARDWRALAEFYERVFGCVRVPPERDYRSAALDAGTGLRDAHLTGAHLRLPGWVDSGPTLELNNRQGCRSRLRGACSPCRSPVNGTAI
jgi:hypothetical protein